MTGEKQTLVDVQILLKNGREVFVTIDEAAGDTYTETPDEIVIATRHEDIRQEYTVQRSEVAFRQRTIREVMEDPRSYRTLGRAEQLPS